MSNKNILSDLANISHIGRFVLALIPFTPLVIKNIRNWLFIHPWVMFFVIVLSWLCVIILVTILLRMRDKNRIKSNKLPNEINISGPYILIVDDDQNILDAFEKKCILQTYPNTALSTSLPHKLMTRSFDIIIADIANAGYKGGMTDVMLTEIKLDYPYKFICAISSTKSYENKVKTIDKFYYKDKSGNYIDNIMEDIRNYKEKMRNEKPIYGKS